MSLELLYGNAVTGNQRFQRPKLQERLLRTLDRSVGIKMFGLRRIGKSTLRLFVIEQMQQSGKQVAFVDAQGLHSIEDLLAELFRALPQETKLTSKALGFLAKDSPIRNTLEALAKGTKLGENVVAAYWKEAYNSIRDALKQSDNPPLLVIDEFTFLLKNVLEADPKAGRAQVDHLLAAMREWRDAGMKMLLTGSIGLTALSRQHQLNCEHLNDLLPFEVPELSEAEAREFIAQATTNPPWSEAHSNEFIRQCGVLYPSFLVKGLLEIGIEAPAAPECFADIFAEYVRPILHEDFYQQFNKRFRVYGDIDKQQQNQLVLPVLKRVMEADAGTSLDDLGLADNYTRIDLAEVLDMLVEDGFLRFSEDAEANRTWYPASRLAAFWWKRARLA